MKLMVLLRRMQKCYEGVDIKGNTHMIRKICKTLRKYQRVYESLPKKDKQPVQYYKGNISYMEVNKFRTVPESILIKMKRKSTKGSKIER